MSVAASGPPWPCLTELHRPSLRQTDERWSLPTVHALDTMRALASTGEVINVRTGDPIFLSGESGDCMFGLLEGTVELTWNGDSGHETIQAGDVFGAGALVTHDHRRYGNARAVTPCKLLVMNREKFLFAVQESPMFAIELLGSIDQRLRDLKDCIRH
jgi:CRP/FNR family cyclic AMP-dependent transcriptional regulator